MTDATVPAPYFNLPTGRISPHAIIVLDRLRKLLPDRVATMRHSIDDLGQLQPIELVETDQGLRLIDGAVRVAACMLSGQDLDAVIHPAGAFGSETDIRIREIAHDLVRFDLTALERAVYIAEWRAAHESKFPPAKPGRKKAATLSDEDAMELSANFALNFPNVVKETLGLSRRAVFLALKVAGIHAEARDQLAPLRIADNQSELLAIAGEPAGRQIAIAELLVAGASSVLEALATMDQTAAPVALAAWERTAATFARLRADDQHKFFSLHEDAILVWLASRKA